MVLTTTVVESTVGTFVNTVEIASASPDRYPSNNRVQSSATLSSAADLSVSQSGFTTASGETTWLIRVQNLLSSYWGAADEVVIVDTLPPGLMLSGWYHRCYYYCTDSTSRR